jgi:hypothetical protein
MGASLRVEVRTLARSAPSSSQLRSMNLIRWESTNRTRTYFYTSTLTARLAPSIFN